MPDILFDDALDLLVATVVEFFGPGALSKGIVLRDTSGRLTFVTDKKSRGLTNKGAFIDSITQRIGAYAREDRVLLTKEDPGAGALLSKAEALPITVGEHTCWLVDRRIVGSGWLARPNSNVKNPPRIVFASLKGGVGRSTALSVVASDFSARGLNVLAIDLDLEAPGLGDLLLSDDRMPAYGTIDYLVENNVGGVADSLLPSFVGLSPLTQGSGGRIDVIPAIGTRSAGSPQNVLSKMARALADDISLEGELLSLDMQIRQMVDRFSTSNSYDIILIDSRAGLSELTAPTVFGLGALVLLFGTAQRQTIAGYRSLFAAFKILAIRDRFEGRGAGWRQLFKPVYAKASLNANIGKMFQEEFYELFVENIYDAESETGDEFYHVADDLEAPHSPLIVPFSQGFVDFDPIRASGTLVADFYEQTFRQFLIGLERALLISFPDSFRGR